MYFYWISKWWFIALHSTSCLCPLSYSTILLFHYKFQARILHCVFYWIVGYMCNFSAFLLQTLPSVFSLFFLTYFRDNFWVKYISLTNVGEYLQYNKNYLPQQFFAWPTGVSLAKGRESRWDEIFTVCFTVTSTELGSQVNFEICVSRAHSVALSMGLQVCHKDQRGPESPFVSVWWVNLYWTPGGRQTVLSLHLSKRTVGENTIKYGLRQGKKITHNYTDSQNILIWKEPTRITKTKS